MKYVLLISSVLLLGAAGCSSTECGDGTYDKDGQCLATVPVPCGPGTKIEGAVCVIDAEGGGGGGCGPGTIQLGDVCVSRNGARANTAELSLPTALAATANGPLATQYGEGQAILLFGVLQPNETDTLFYGGQGTTDDEKPGVFFMDRADGWSATATEVSDNGDGTKTYEAGPFTLPFALAGTDPIYLLETMMTDVIVGEVDGIQQIKSFSFTSVMTPANCQVYLPVIKGPLCNLLPPASVDLDYDPVDGTNESWTFAGTMTTESVWML